MDQRFPLWTPLKKNYNKNSVPHNRMCVSPIPCTPLKTHNKNQCPSHVPCYDHLMSHTVPIKQNYQLMPILCNILWAWNVPCYSHIINHKVRMRGFSTFLEIALARELKFYIKNNRTQEFFTFCYYTISLHFSFSALKSVVSIRTEF